MLRTSGPQVPSCPRLPAAILRRHRARQAPRLRQGSGGPVAIGPRRWPGTLRSAAGWPRRAPASRWRHSRRQSAGRGRRSPSGSGAAQRDDRAAPRTRRSPPARRAGCRESSSDTHRAGRRPCRRGCGRRQAPAERAPARAESRAAGAQGSAATSCCGPPTRTPAHPVRAVNGIQTSGASPPVSPRKPRWRHTDDGECHGLEPEGAPDRPTDPVRTAASSTRR